MSQLKRNDSTAVIRVRVPSRLCEAMPTKYQGVGVDCAHQKGNMLPFGATQCLEMEPRLGIY